MWLISETHIFSSNNINQVSFGFNRIFNHICRLAPDVAKPPTSAFRAPILEAHAFHYWLPSKTESVHKDCLSCGLSSIQMTNYWSLGDRGFAPFQGGTNVYSVSDTFDMIRGQHNIRPVLEFAPTR